MKQKLVIFLGILAAGVLTSCTEETDSVGDAPDAVTPHDVKRVVGNLEDDLLRVLAITEVLEIDQQEMVRRVLDDHSFQDLIAARRDEVEAMAGLLLSMPDEERILFTSSVRSALAGLSLRINDVYASGAAAEDAFGPLFEEIMSDLRSML